MKQGAVLCGVVLLLVLGAAAQDKGKEVSFKQDVAPIIQKNCIPCHAEDNFNPSELSLDSYSSLMQGGKHGSPVVPGKASESLIMKKLEGDPPFGDPMPLAKKRPDGTKQQRKLTPEELTTIRAWIDPGAKDN